MRSFSIWCIILLLFGEAFVVAQAVSAPALLVSETERRICDAIEKKVALRIKYHYDRDDGKQRYILPHQMGYTRWGSFLLNAVQISGYSKSGSPSPWRNFHVARIIKLEVTDEKFLAHDQYRPAPNKFYEDAVCQIEP